MDPDQTPTPGDLPGFFQPDDHLIAASALTVFISLGVIAARTYTKAAILRDFDHTDCVLMIAGALVVAFVFFAAGAVSIDYLMILNGLQIIYGPIMFSAKYVVLRQIEVVFFNHSRKALAFIAIRVLIWANLLFYTTTSIAFIFGCIPRAKISDVSIPGKCINAHAATVASSGINVVSDLIIFILPIIAIWQLQIPPKKKIGVAVVFGAGVLAIVTSIVRLYYSILLARTDDAMHIVRPLGVWVLGELTAVILVACLPYLPRLYHHVLLKFRKTGSPVSVNNTQITSHELRSFPPARITRDQYGSSVTLHVLGDAAATRNSVGEVYSSNSRVQPQDQKLTAPI
ncbi:hypothetical protein F4808DRAFT_213140 [Astrocystis sublimbata]|nr:hypothetical protein F4808DRAFT_213140 [Astrocystis sublimbata]